MLQLVLEVPDAVPEERRPRMAAWKLAESTLDADQLGYVEVDNETSEPWLVLQEIANAHGRGDLDALLSGITNRHLRRAGDPSRLLTSAVQNPLGPRAPDAKHSSLLRSISS